MSAGDHPALKRPVSHESKGSNPYNMKGKEMNAKQGEHTPGPWTVGHPNLQEDTWFHRIFYADNRGVYEVAVIDKRKRPGANADASLIAAAPELLAALESVITWAERHKLNLADCIDGKQRECPVIMDARAAIAKARGAV